MKRVLSLLTAVLLVFGLWAFSASAEETVTVDIGSETLEFHLVDDFAGIDWVIDGWEHYGQATVKDGKIVINAPTNFFDCYDFKPDSIANYNWNGMKCIIFEVTNDADGDLLFAFQPIDEFRCNLRLSSLLAEQAPVKLYDTDKHELTDAKWAGVGALNGRDGFTIPWKFTGYVIIPFANITYDGEPTTPVLEENVGVNNYGFHVMPDDASSVLMTISGVYACDHLPGTPAPEKTTEAPTAAPTEAPTAAPTEAPTAAPTEAPTAAPTEAPTTAPTEAPTEVPTEAEKTGCKGVIGGSAALILTAVAAAVALKKR